VRAKEAIMRAGPVVGLAVLSFMLCATLARAASADGTAAVASDAASCVDENGDFETNGSAKSFVFTITNKCEKRLKCTVDAYVTTAKGPASGHGTLVIEPKSHGDAAKKSFTMKVKVAGGTAQVSRDCKII
jgi:hypothetical protein